MAFKLDDYLQDDGKLRSHTFPGCYPIFYVTEDCGVLCPDCASEPEPLEETRNPSGDKQWRIVGAEVHWEGPPMQCDHCYRDIESAYGDPDKDD